MEKTNSVWMNGIVRPDRFAVVHRTPALVVADFLFGTAVPKADAPRENRKLTDYELMFHNVRVTAAGDDVQKILDLERSCRERPKDPKVFELRGVLYEDDRVNRVECRAEDLVQTRQFRTSGNNKAELVGSVLATTFSDLYATVTLDTGRFRDASGQEKDVVNTAYILRSEFPEAWEAVSKGKYKKGSVMSMSGPVHSGFYNDGRERFVRMMVQPRVVEKVKMALARKVNQGPSIG